MKQLYNVGNLRDLDKLVIVVAALKEGVYHEHHARQHTASAPHV